MYRPITVTELETVINKFLTKVKDQIHSQVNYVEYLEKSFKSIGDNSSLNIRHNSPVNVSDP